MDTGDWRYGRGSDDAPWTEPSTGSTPTSDLWAAEDADTSGWTSTPSWRPRHQADAADSAPISPSPIDQASTTNGSYGSGIGSPVTGFPSGGYPIPGFGYTPARPAPNYGAAPTDPSTYGGSTYGGSTYGGAGYGGTGYGAGTYGDESTYTSAPSSGAAYGTAPSSGAAYGTAPSSGAAYGTARSFGTPSSFSTALPTRPSSSSTFGPESRRAAAASQLAASGRGGSGDDARAGTSFGRVFGFTAIWYGAPLVLYLLWLVITSGDREALAGRALVAGIPWMLGAVAVSAGMAVLLRRITIGWGTVGVSFAAAVIGAGLATIVHSFA